MTSLQKKILITLGVLIGLYVVLSVIGHYLPAWEKYSADKKDAELNAELAAARAHSNELYAADTIGGKTPEETIDLFITALKKGDALLASGYYKLDVREKALASLKDEWAKHGNFDLSIAYFAEVREKGKKTCVDIEKELGGCTFEYSYVTDSDRNSVIVGTNDKIFIPKGSQRSKAVDFGLNRYTKVWKIEKPY